MRTLDDLRRSFEQHADLAGEPRGLVQAAREGAVRIRRRRRMVRAGVSAAVLAVLVVAVPVVANRTLAEKQVPAAPAERRFGQVTVELDVPGLTVEAVTSSATRQYLIVGPANGQSGAEVIVFDPGAYTARSQPGIESITVAGRDAWFQPAIPIGGLTDRPTDDAFGPAVGWVDRSGVQVVVYMRAELDVQNGLDVQRTELLRVAEGLRIGPPRDVTVPFRLGWVPAGLEIAGITATPDAVGATGSVTLRRGNIDVVDVAVGAPGSQPGTFDGLEQTPLTVAGRPAVLVDFKQRRRLVVLEYGTCGVAVETADKQTTTADLVRVLETLTVGDCTDRSTWTRPQR
jgi:hypothetical protein